MTDQFVLNTYRLHYRILGDTRHIRALSVQGACDKAGWLVGDVWVTCLGSTNHAIAELRARLVNRRTKPPQPKAECESDHK